MKYLERLSDEFVGLRDAAQYSTTVKKSKSRHLAKLRRYIARVRGEHVPKQKWLAKVFQGRINRTPWRVKNQKYVAKANRPL